jgi:hypothetical protein
VVSVIGGGGGCLVRVGGAIAVDGCKRLGADTMIGCFSSQGLLGGAETLGIEEVGFVFAGGGCVIAAPGARAWARFARAISAKISSSLAVGSADKAIVSKGPK